MSQSTELAPSLNLLAAGVAHNVEKMASCLHQLEAALHGVNAEKSQMHDAISSLRRDVQRVAAVVEGSPALVDDEELKKCLALIKFAEAARSTPSAEEVELCTASWPLDRKPKHEADPRGEEHRASCGRSVQLTHLRRQAKQPQSLLHCPPAVTVPLASSQPSSQHFYASFTPRSVSPASRPVSPMRPQADRNAVQPPGTKPPVKRRPHGPLAVVQA